MSISVIQQFLQSVRSIDGVLDVFVLDETGSCIGSHSLSGRDTAPAERHLQAVERLRALVGAMTGSERAPRQTFLVRYERRYLMLKVIDTWTVLLSARSNANLSMINVGFRVLDLKLAKNGTDPGFARSPTEDSQSTVDALLRAPLITRLQDLFAEYLGPTSRILFKNRVRILSPALAPPIAEEQYQQLVTDLARFIRDPGRQALFSARAESVRLSVLCQALTEERNELRTLIDTVEEGIRICHRITAPVSGADLVEDEQVSNERASEVIEYCATNDSILAKHGASFRESFLRLTDQMLSLRRELSEAGLLQRMLVPRNHVIDHSFAQLAAYFVPAAQCGGDWWTAKHLPDDRLLVVVGDVTGHSLSTAIITGVAKATCDIADASGADITCERLLECMNASIYDATQSKVLMTCVASIIDPRTRTVTVASAGHQFPYLVRQQNGTSRLQALVARGNPLGAKPTLEVETVSTTLQSGDLLIWYTDGTTDCENDQAEPFGDRRFRRIIGNAVGLDARAVRDTIGAELDNFRGNAPRNDDVTFIAGKVVNWDSRSPLR